MIEFINSQPGDFMAIARCHISAFPGSLSSKLGTRYCMKMVEWYYENERGVLFHCAESGKLVGYCGGIKRNDAELPGSSTSITQYTFNAIICSLLKRPWLVFHPEIMDRIPFIWKNIMLKTGLRRKKVTGKNTQDKQPYEPSLGLVAIGVDPQYQGKGYGTLLLREFEKRAVESGYKRIHLSVKKNNFRAITAYTRNGWQVLQSGKDELTMFKIPDKA